MDALHPTKAAILWAVIVQPRPSVRSVMEAAGLRSTSTVYRHLLWLRDRGLVEWDAGRNGTLRSTLTVAAMDRSLLPSGGATPKRSRTSAA